MRDNKLYQEYLEKLEQLNKTRNKAIDKRSGLTTEQVIEVWDKCRQEEIRLEQEAFEQNLLPEIPQFEAKSHPVKKQHYESKGCVQKLDSDNWVIYNRMDTWGGSLIYKY